MKLIIMPYIDRFPDQTKQSEKVCLEHLDNMFKTLPVQQSRQAIELQDDQSVRSQIDSVLDHLDINSLLDPTMPNLGGMEVMATIKRDLSIELKAMLAAQNK